MGIYRQDGNSWTNPAHLPGAFFILQGGTRFVVQGANWNPEVDLPEAERRVVTPEEFRSGVVLVTDPRFVQYVTEHPDELQRMDDRQFEEFVAELTKMFGYTPRLGPRGRDGGIDVTAERDTGLIRELMLIQCKRYGPENKVGVQVVKQLYADVEVHGATSGLVVTTSTFTAPALDYIEQVKYRLAGRDLEHLKQWLASAHAGIVSGSP
jgi:restriction endonuclease Mrr